MDKNIVKNKFLKAVAALAAALILAAAALLSGCGILGSMGSTDTRKWVIKTVKQNYYFYDEMDKTDIDNLSVEEIVARLDIYSEFYTREELQALIKDNSGQKAGVGFSYIHVDAGASSIYPEGGCLIVTVVGNSPAEKAGMKAGQLLVSGTYDGQTSEFKEVDDVGNFIDPIAASVKFTLTVSTGESFEVSKQEYTASYMFMATNASAWTPTFDGDGDANGVKEVADRAIEYLPDGAAYFSMSQFYGGAADEFGYLLKEYNAQHCTSLILDLRNNGGGYVDVMQDMAGYFTSSLGKQTRVAMTARYKSGREEVADCIYHSIPDSSGRGLVPTGTTVYVLANSGTASASEALIGVLVSYGFLKYENIFLSDYGEEFMKWAGDDYGTAKSYGKGIMQSTFTNYMTGEALKLTTAQIYWPNGKCIHGVGLTAADGCRLVEADWLVTPEDDELKKVITMIKG